MAFTTNFSGKSTLSLQTKVLPIFNTRSRVDADEVTGRHADATVGKFHARSPVITLPQPTLLSLSELSPLGIPCFE